MFYINKDYSSDEKYDIAKFMEYQTDNYDVLTSYMLNNIKSLPTSGVFKISVEEERPDLISYKIYGTVTYWSLILLYNDIVDLSELKSGKSINYFDVRDFENLYYDLTTK